jgi:cellulose synthase/poly-beta-1,6-N-acetylglucosamine synthase-like glycosyltransferase
VETWQSGARYLVPAGEDAEHALSIPDARYVITLDADSLLAHDYARRLVGVMEQPEHERTAVIQTPYTAIPGAPSQLERIAGATTDIQYLIHQGFTAFDATYWVGANALLRKSALDDIRVEVEERGYMVPCFIQDRTVIEDTESTIDLVAGGWRLHNYPERLAFSATPPDFGSLLIQRRRWANGGLLILPKLLRHGASSLLAGRFRPVELFVRAHYLVSIAATSVGLLALLFLPLGADFDSPWLPLTALPYFVLYARDLRRIGYRRSDLLRVYAFNLLLLPVNLAGVAKSMQQAISGEKIPFGRTPKVAGRTAAPAWAITTEWLLLFACVFFGVSDAIAGQWSHAAFTMLTGLGMLYAIVAFVGVRESAEDIRLGFRRIGSSLAGRVPTAVPRPQRTSE